MGTQPTLFAPGFCPHMPANQLARNRIIVWEKWQGASALPSSPHVNFLRNIEVHPNIAELYAKMVTELQSLLTDETTRSQAMDTVRSMIDKIGVHAGTERDKPDVILVGALAQILNYTQQNKTAASNGSDGRALMVAGARNHRELILPPIAI